MQIEEMPQETQQDTVDENPQEYKEEINENLDLERSEKESRIMQYLDELNIKQAIPSDREREYYENNRKKIQFQVKDNKLAKNRMSMGFVMPTLQVKTLQTNAVQRDIEEVKVE